MQAAAGRERGGHRVMLRGAADGPHLHLEMLESPLFDHGLTDRGPSDHGCVGDGWVELAQQQQNEHSDDGPR